MVHKSCTWYKTIWEKVILNQIVCEWTVKIVSELNSDEIIFFYIYYDCNVIKIDI